MYIHEQADWPSFRWSEKQLIELLAKARHQQGLVLGRMSSMGFDIQTEASFEVLAANIIKSSEIEGEVLDLNQVRSSLAKHLGVDMAGLPPVDRYTDGVVEMMLNAVEDFTAPLTKERLFAWHSALFPLGRSGLSEITVGAWRTAASGPMQVVSGPIGRESIHFEAPVAKRLEKEMTAFLKWFNSEDAMDPIIKAGVAHFWFVTIHPFDDGNGRIARAIADMCLARADGISKRFYSMSAQIEKERKAYYTQLEKSQKSDLDITAWLEWFLQCLDRSMKQADLILKNVLHKAAVWKRLSEFLVNDRQKKILTLMFGEFEGKLTTSKYAKIAKCSVDTALRDIQALIEYGVMKKAPAAGRSTSYVLINSGDKDKSIAYLGR